MKSRSIWPIAGRILLVVLVATSLSLAGPTGAGIAKPRAVKRGVRVEKPRAVSPHNMLGGLDLDAYCEDQGFDRSELARDRKGFLSAFNNWQCVDSGAPAPINLHDACAFQYERPLVIAWPRNLNDAYTWTCYGL